MPSMQRATLVLSSPSDGLENVSNLKKMCSSWHREYYLASQESINPMALINSKGHGFAFRSYVSISSPRLEILVLQSHVFSDKNYR